MGDEVRGDSGVALLGPGEIRELAARAGVRPTKALGQNFVLDAGTVRKIVRQAEVAPGEVVVEVGPGLGSLTLGLLEAGADVVAVEIDPVLARLLPGTVAAHVPGLVVGPGHDEPARAPDGRDGPTGASDGHDEPARPPTRHDEAAGASDGEGELIRSPEGHDEPAWPPTRHDEPADCPAAAHDEAAARGELVAALRDGAGRTRLRVLLADALDVTALPGPAPTALVANLPYNISVPVLLAFLARFGSLRRALVMVQAEVADRLVAPPGGRTYGVPSVKVGWWAAARRTATVGRAVFWPAPNVDSALVRLDRRDPPPTNAPREAVFAVVDAAFGQRRKMLRSALAELFGSSAAAQAALREAGVDPTARGEAVDVAGFARIAERLPGPPAASRTGTVGT